LKSLEKDKEISKDELKKSETDVQKVTDSAIAEVDQVLQKKEADLMEV